MDKNVSKLICQMRKLEVTTPPTSQFPGLNITTPMPTFPKSLTTMKKCSSTNDLISACTENENGLLPLLRQLLPNMIRESVLTQFSTDGALGNETSPTIILMSKDKNPLVDIK